MENIKLTEIMIRNTQLDPLYY